MLILLMTEETPGPSNNRFESQSFAELLLMTPKYSKIICEKGKRAAVIESWDNFVKSWEKENAGDIKGNLQQKWNKKKHGLTEMSSVPENSVQLNDFIVLEPAIMFRRIIDLLYSPKSLSNLGSLVDELRPYSLDADRITLYDRYLLQFDLDIFDIGKAGHCSKTLRKLVTLFRGLVSDETSPPEEVHIITNLVNPYRLERDSERGLDWLTSPEYRSRVYQILDETITELRNVYPALNATHFTIFDCSAVTKGGLAHDRFITFNRNPLISSAGFCFNLSKLDFDNSDWGDENVSRKNISIDPTVIFPVNVAIKLPKKYNKIEIART